MVKKRGGSKVTGAKLKAKPSKATLDTVHHSTDDEDGQGDTSFDARMEARGELKPLQDCVLSFSAIQDQSERNDLIATAKKLGAKVEGALTTDVTHLITEHVESPKYKCAIEWGKLVMKPEWITALHSAYVKAEEIDLISMINKYRLPPLHNLIIAITGFPLPPQTDVRSTLIAKIAAAGGTYKSTFDKSCTHLLVGPTVNIYALRENRKITLANSFEVQYGKGPIPVWHEWLDDSLWFKGALDEGGYNVNLTEKRPDPERVLSVKTMEVKPSSQTLLRQETVMNQPSMQGIKTSTPQFFLPIIPVEGASTNDPVENVVIKKGKLRRINSAMTDVNDLLGIATSDERSRMPIDDNDVKSAPREEKEKALSSSLMSRSSKSMPQLSSQEKEERAAGPSAGSSKSTTLLGKARSSSFAPVSKPFDNSFGSAENFQSSQRKSLPLPLKRIHATESNTRMPDPLEPALKKKRTSDKAGAFAQGRQGDKVQTFSEEREENHKQIFAGLTLALSGFDAERLEHVISAIKLRMGRVITEWHPDTCDEHVDWIIVPFSNPPSFIDLDDPRVVSGQWLERCVWLEELVEDRDVHFACRPMRHGRVSLGLTLTFSGFDEFTMNCVEKISLSAGYSLSRLVDPSKTTHLIAQEESRKCQIAREHRIPIQDLDWFINELRMATIFAKEPTSNLILKDVVICFSSVLSGTANRSTLSSLAQKMGATCLPSYSSSVTHFIHASKTISKQKDFRQAKEAGKCIVHPRWLEECEKEQRRADEFAFPYTYQSKRALSLAAASESSSFNSQLIKPTLMAAFDQSQGKMPESLTGQRDTPFEIGTAAHITDVDTVPGEVEDVAPRCSTPPINRGSRDLPLSPSRLLQSPRAVQSQSMPDLLSKWADTSKEPSQLCQAFSSPKMSDADLTANTTLTVLDQMRKIAANTPDIPMELDPNSSYEGKLGRKRKRRLTHSRHSAPPSGAAIIFNQSHEFETIPKDSGLKIMRTAWDMTQAADGTAPEEETANEQSMRITITDPAAERAKAQLRSRIQQGC